MTAAAMHFRRGPTDWEVTLVIEILLAVAAAALYWYATALNSPDPEARERAVGRVTDPAVLQRMATTDESPRVRRAAIARVDDARALAQAAAADSDAFVREAAVKRVQDPTLLARVATSDAMPHVRAIALERLTDPATLLKVATGDGGPELREAALRKLSATELQRAAAAAADVQQRATLQLAAQLLSAAEPIPTEHRNRILLPLLVLPARYSEPQWVARYGSVQSLKLDRRATWQGYNRGHTIQGEAITLTVKFSRRAAPLSAQWRTQFPGQTSRWQTWIPAQIQASDAMSP